jgi:hypothetical protein
MTYATSDAIWVMPPWLRTLHSRATVWSDWVDNTTKGSQEEIGYLFILFRTLDKFLCHILPIKHAYNIGISRLRLEDMTLVIYPDSGRTYWLWSTSQLRTSLLTPVTHHNSGWWVRCLSYHLSCERHCMTGLDDCNILQPEHLVRKRLGGTHDLIIVQNLRSHSFTCGSSQAMCRTTKEHLACRWVSGGTWYPTTLEDQGLQMSGQAST